MSPQTTRVSRVIISGQTRAPVIADVARVAGVSVPTVSRVLTGSTPVSPDKRERVLAAIRELGYRPNASARALVSGRRSMIAIVAGDTTRYGYSSTIHGIEEAARAAGYLVVITVVEPSQDGVEDTTARTAVDLVLGQPVAGVVVLEFDPVGIRVAEEFPESVPLVSAGGVPTADARAPRSFLGDRAAARSATEYLLGLGHATVHHVSPPDLDPPLGRTLGWSDALREAGIEAPPVIACDWEPAAGRELGLALAERDDVTALLCANDQMAIGVIRGLHEAGRSVPGDVSVMGFDDEPLAAVTIPALTTVAQDFIGLGRRAFELLEQIITSGSAPALASSSPQLVVRESTGAPRR